MQPHRHAGAIGSCALLLLLSVAGVGAARAADPPKGPGVKQPPTGISPTGPEPRLGVGLVGYTPTLLKVSQPVSLFAQVRNDGSAASTAGAFRLRLACQVLGGGPTCPIPAWEIPLPAIQVKGAHPVATPFVTLAAAGSYRITFTVHPWSPGSTPRTMDLTVAP